MFPKLLSTYIINPTAIKEFLNRKKNFEINITFSEEETLMGTGGALIKAKEEIGTETFILSFRRLIHRISFRKFKL